MNIQEDIENKSIALAIKTAKVTEQVLAKAMIVMLQKMRQARDTPKVGRQSLRRLSKSGNLSNVEITENNIKSFDPIAREYRISYALKRDESDPNRWVVFFRAKDQDSMTAAFKKFSAKTLNREADKPSVRDTMRNFREKMKNVVKDRIRVKHRAGPEL